MTTRRQLTVLTTVLGLAFGAILANGQVPGAHVVIVLSLIGLGHLLLKDYIPKEERFVTMMTFTFPVLMFTGASMMGGVTGLILLVVGTLSLVPLFWRLKKYAY